MSQGPLALLRSLKGQGHQLWYMEWVPPFIDQKHGYKYNIDKKMYLVLEIQILFINIVQDDHELIVKRILTTVSSDFHHELQR